MCQTTGPKFFLPPNALGSTGNYAAPVNYPSSPQATTDVGNPANVPAPAAPAATTPAPPTNPLRPVNSGMFGGGASNPFLQRMMMR
jgi:hypothetical protein